MKILLLRHETAPMPMGCRWCGVGDREHAQRWVPGHSWHGWVQPTKAQIEARLPFNLARQRTSRRGGLSTTETHPTPRIWQRSKP